MSISLVGELSFLPTKEKANNALSAYVSIPLVGELPFLTYLSESGSIKQFQRLFLQVYFYSLLLSAFLPYF